MAIDEMLSPERIAETASPDPRAWNSELSELQVQPLTGEEHKPVVECLNAIAPAQCHNRPSESLNRACMVPVVSANTGSGMDV
jgi:hypothetical protein